LYDNGRGVKLDIAQAAAWYRLAAENGHVSAQFRMGYLYEHGEAVPANPVEAYAWTRLAAAQDYAGATAILQRMAANLSPDLLDQAQALSRQYWNQFVTPFQSDG
jgi:TPR repeat protein